MKQSDTFRFSKIDSSEKETIDNFIDFLKQGKFGEQADKSEYLGSLMYQVCNVKEKEQISPFWNSYGLECLVNASIGNELEEVNNFLESLIAYGVFNKRQVCDSIINSYKIIFIDGVYLIQISDNRSESKDFTIQVEPNFFGHDVIVFKGIHNKTQDNYKGFLQWDKSDLHEEGELSYSDNFFHERTYIRLFALVLNDVQYMLNKV